MSRVMTDRGFHPLQTETEGVREQLGVRGELAGPEGSHAACWQCSPGGYYRRP